MRLMKRSLGCIRVAAGLSIGAAACSNTSTPAPISFALSSRNPAVAPSAAWSSANGSVAAAAVAPGSDSTITVVGTDTIILRSVQLVVRQVELKRADVTGCSQISGSGDCADFETGPVLLSLPLGNGTVKEVTVTATPGVYNAFEFEVHKPSSGDTSDAAFIAANPAFANISIRGRGTYSQAGTRSNFTFTSTVDAKQERAINPAITLPSAGSVNVTLRVDVWTWFLNAAKTALVDPASANPGGPNESVVANNIQASFEAFRDDAVAGVP